MRPVAIVTRAKQKGLDVIGICDHNSTGNVAAVRRAGDRKGVTVMGGIEITSKEEVHMLGLFDDAASLCAIQQLMDKNLRGENNPELFGEQHLCNEHDAIVGRDSRLLIGATGLSVEEVVKSIHRFGGLAVASHVDRESFSIISQLGFVPERLQMDALEVSPFHSLAEAKDRFPQIRAYPLIRASDAHRLEEIDTISTAFAVASPRVAEFRKALHGESERKVLN
jgi:predicted metal-dependent phosphoesterase TrpH